MDAGEPSHEDCVKAVQGITGSLVTVWPVLTEVMHLLGDSARGQEAILEMIEMKAVELAALGAEDVPRIRDLMRKYRDHPMDLADAVLVRVAERERISRILTLDRRDFSVYRVGRLGRFIVLP